MGLGGKCSGGSDGILNLRWLFLVSPVPVCPPAAPANNVHRPQRPSLGLAVVARGGALAGRRKRSNKQWGFSSRSSYGSPYNVRSDHLATSLSTLVIKPTPHLLAVSTPHSVIVGPTLLAGSFCFAPPAALSRLRTKPVLYPYSPPPSCRQRPRPLLCSFVRRPRRLARYRQALHRPTAQPSNSDSNSAGPDLPTSRTLAWPRRGPSNTTFEIRFGADSRAARRNWPSTSANPDSHTDD